MWDARTLAPLARLAPRAKVLDTGDYVDGVAFSPDGQTLAAVNGDGRLRLWRTRTWARLATLRPGEATGQSVAFSPDGTILAAGEGGNVLLWDAHTHERLAVLHTPGEFVHHLVFSPDGARLAAAADGVRIWDARTHELLRKSAAPNGGALESALDLAFSPDGRTLAGSVDAGGAGATIELWDGRTARPLATLVGPPSVSQNVFGVAFSPDGRTLAGGGDSLLLWDTRTHDLVTRLEAGALEAVAFSPDGRTVIAGAADGSIHMWQGLFWRSFAELRTEICKLAVGNLTRNDWKELVPRLPYRTTCAD